LFRWPLDPPAPRPAFEDMAAAEAAVRMILTACGDSDPRRLPTKRLHGLVAVRKAVIGPSPARWAWHVRPRPIPLLDQLAGTGGLAGDHRI